MAPDAGLLRKALEVAGGTYGPSEQAVRREPEGAIGRRHAHPNPLPSRERRHGLPLSRERRSRARDLFRVSLDSHPSSWTPYQESGFPIIPASSRRGCGVTGHDSRRRDTQITFKTAPEVILPPLKTPLYLCARDGQQGTERDSKCYGYYPRGWRAMPE
jgi:hypothetical protein